MNIFKYEINQYMKSIIIWSIVYAISIFLFMQYSTVFISESESIKPLLEGFGDAITGALNINIDLFFSEVGFYSYIFTYVGLAASIQAMNMGIGIFSKENRMKTADFLMSKPRSRSSIFLSKLLVCISVLIITELSFYLFSYLSISIVTGGNFSVIPFTLISLTLSIIHFMFLALGIFISNIIRRIKSSISITMAFVLSFFFMGMLSAITNSEVLRYISLLKYFDSNYIMSNNTYELKYLILSIVFVTILLISSYVIYLKKDIESV